MLERGDKQQGGDHGNTLGTESRIENMGGDTEESKELVQHDKEGGVEKL